MVGGAFSLLAALASMCVYSVHMAYVSQIMHAHEDVA